MSSAGPGTQPGSARFSDGPETVLKLKTCVAKRLEARPSEVIAFLLHRGVP
jgi:hypothetical protein